MRTKLGICAVAFAAGMYAFGASAIAETPSQISGAINENELVTLTHNTRPEATAANDRGPVSSVMELTGVELLLRRSDANEKAFEKVISDLHNPKSASFHHWLTNAEIGERFGVNTQDIAKISDWLTSHGLEVTGFSPDHTIISFSGTAGQMDEIFHTSIHNLSVDGVNHYANMSDPKIPAALASTVAGVVTLHNFHPHPMLVKRFVPSSGKLKPNYSLASGCFPATPTGTHSGSFTNECEFVVPADLATIYDIKPAFNAGITGKGQTIVVLEDTNVYKVADWNIFRAIMGLTGYTDATFTQTHPTGTATCTNPGVVSGDEGRE